jgi:uncharacterized protein YndB with AHSA1/START domain
MGKLSDPIVVERTFDATPHKIWRALTDKSEMKKWYFDLEAFEPRVGFQFHFYGGEEGGDQFRHNCEIKEVIPEKKISYSWQYEGYAGNSLVTFELTPDGNRTKLTLTHEGVHTFPADNKAFRKENFVGGWNDIINNSLKKYLEG